MRAPEVIWSRSIRASMRKPPVIGIRIGMIFHHRGVHRAQLVASLIESGAGSKLAEEFGHAMDAAGDHRGGKMMRADDQVADNLGFRGIRHRGFKDADDRGGTIAKAAEADGLANHIRILFVNGGPETIREHDDARGVGAAVLQVRRDGRARGADPLRRSSCR